MKLFALGCGFLVSLLGLLVLLGWGFDISILKSVHPTFVSMKVNTAICFFLAGISLILLQLNQENLQHVLIRLFAGVIVLISALTLFEFLAGKNLGIDNLLWQEEVGAIGTYHLGRMAPTTAFNFLLIGLALFFLHRNSRIVCILVCPAAILSLLALMGYFYGVKEFYGVVPYTQMALHTSVAFSILIVGIFISNSEGPIMRLILSSTSGGFMLRRLLPVVMITPVFLGGLIMIGESYGLYDVKFGMIIFILLSVGIFVAMLIVHSLILNRIEKEQEELRTTQASLEYIRHIDKEKEKLIHQLQEAFQKIETLSGLLPVCAWCRRIRDDHGNWNEMEQYIQDRSKAQFTHGICPDCAKKQSV